MTAIELGNTAVHATHPTPGYTGITLRNHMIVEAMKASVISNHVPVDGSSRDRRAEGIIALVDRVIEEAAKPIKQS